MFDGLYLSIGVVGSFLKLALKGPTFLKNDDMNDDDTMLPEKRCSWAT